MFVDSIKMIPLHSFPFNNSKFSWSYGRNHQLSDVRAALSAILEEKATSPGRVIVQVTPSPPKLPFVLEKIPPVQPRAGLHLLKREV